MKRKLMEMWVVCTADKKKASMLGALLLVLVGMVIKTALQGGGGPASAIAKSDPESGNSSASRATSWASLAADAAARGPIIRVEAPSALRRDLFLLNEHYFPPPAQTEVTAQVDPKSAGGTVEIERTDPAQEREAARQRVVESARLFKLRSTLVGSNPLAVIEFPEDRGRRSIVLRPGQSIGGFVLKEIRSHGVVLEQDGIEVHLSLELPEG